MALQAIVTPPCPKCQRTSFYEVPAAQFLAWQNGELIQNVFPDWTHDERENLKSGWHPACWDEVFGGLDD